MENPRNQQQRIRRGRTGCAHLQWLMGTLSSSQPCQLLVSGRGGAAGMRGRVEKVTTAPFPLQACKPEAGAGWGTGGLII